MGFTFLLGVEGLFSWSWGCPCFLVVGFFLPPFLMEMALPCPDPKREGKRGGERQCDPPKNDNTEPPERGGGARQRDKKKRGEAAPHLTSEDFGVFVSCFGSGWAFFLGHLGWPFLSLGCPCFSFLLGLGVSHASFIRIGKNETFKKRPETH